ncbi:MAG: MBL fold metallo-hydrolase [Asgard group archaeon]|nr:MBL fold metallo-hydrolase [Asgard group archaeon]
MIYENITENVYAITDGSTRGNVCAFVLPSQIVFIDTGMHIPLMKQFREELEKETGKKASTLLITHIHGDHIFANQIFKDCKIIANKDTYNRFIHSMENEWTPEKIEEWKKHTDDPKALEGLEITPPTEFFEKKLEIEDYDIKLVYKNTGGHTKGSSYVYYPEAKALAGGDNLFIGMFPWAGDQSADPQKWINAMKEYLTLDVDYYIPGHGPVCGKEGLQEWLDYLEKAVVLMRKMITERHKEETIIDKVNEIEYHPPRREEWKLNSLKKWYQVLSEK